MEGIPRDVYYAEAEVFGKRVNVMIDTGTVGINKFGDRNINQY